MKTSRTRIRLRIAILVGLLLVLVGAASASAVSLTLPGAGQVAHAGEDGRLTIGERRPLSIPAGNHSPGASVRSRQVVVNDQRQTLRYALTSTSTDGDGKAIRDVVHVTIRTADLGSDAAATCDGFDGSILYDGPLGAATASFGDVEMGSQSGDRLVARGQRETLCFEIGLPLDASNEYQGATTSTTWTIVTEQEAGNP